ncbi:MAG: heat-inducible transcription repressor HrcA, partial [Candidatus Aminicenantales bacterium]
MAQKGLLREKDMAILNLIVESYLKLGKPISSGYVAQQSVRPISSAAVRYIMAKLEARGYLKQPHTSAGRIPTDRGLRFYVNSLLEEAIYPKAAITLPPENIAEAKGDFHSYLNEISRLLSEYSDNLGFVISPRISKVNFRHIRLIKIGEEKIMIILITTFNQVLTEIVDSKSCFTQMELDRASMYVNENFKGKNL